VPVQVGKVSVVIERSLSGSTWPSRAAAAVARLRSAEVGLLGRALRFALAGGLVAGVYLVVTLFLAKVVVLPFQLALGIGFTTALATHFTLQRFFVWVHREEFALPFRAQAGRYLVISLSQYGVTVVATAVLPQALGVSTEIVYVVVTAIITVANFILFRTRVFHPERSKVVK
jgi:putative flippase GtrA